MAKFKFKRIFGTQEELEKLETKVSNSSNAEIAMKCIPNNYPDYIVSEIERDINKFFQDK